MGVIGVPFWPGLALDWRAIQGWIGPGLALDWGGLGWIGSRWRELPSARRHRGFNIFSYSKTDFATAGDAPEDFQRPSKILTI